MIDLNCIEIFYGPKSLLNYHALFTLAEVVCFDANEPVADRASPVNAPDAHVASAWVHIQIVHAEVLNGQSVQRAD